MLLIIGVIAVLALAFVPQWWVKTVFSAYHDDRADFLAVLGKFGSKRLSAGIEYSSEKIEDKKGCDEDEDDRYCSRYFKPVEKIQDRIENERKEDGQEKRE